MIWELIWVDIPKWPVRKRMMKEMAIMIKTISELNLDRNVPSSVPSCTNAICYRHLIYVVNVENQNAGCAMHNNAHNVHSFAFYLNQGFKPEECGGEDSSTASPLKTHPDLCT